ncbi:MAG TPA: Rrf2 family transcriptional regulator [Terriglobales bacterium]|jgi:Rrf2 family protein|nr:Rrf2 family transcriptional regulator [Terriglobales bacterium]
MKISQKGLYALQAMMMLARHHNQGAIRIRDVAYEEELPEKFLELILLELKNARIVESVRGAKGGYQLRRPPSEIYLSEIIRLIDGPLAPFGDAEQLRSLIDRDAEHRALYRVFLEVRDAAARILEHTSLADIVSGQGSGALKARKRRKKKEAESGVLPMVVHGNRGRDE